MASPLNWSTLLLILEQRRDRVLVYLFLKFQLSLEELAALNIADWRGGRLRRLRVLGRKHQVHLSAATTDLLLRYLRHREASTEVRPEDPLFLDDAGKRMAVEFLRGRLSLYGINTNDGPAQMDSPPTSPPHQEDAPLQGNRSATCRQCGHGELELILGGRRWQCPNCGYTKRNRHALRGVSEDAANKDENNGAKMAQNRTKSLLQ